MIITIFIIIQTIFVVLSIGTFIYGILKHDIIAIILSTCWLIAASMLLVDASYQSDYYITIDHNNIFIEDGTGAQEYIINNKESIDSIISLDQSNKQTK